MSTATHNELKQFANRTEDSATVKASPTNLDVVKQMFGEAKQGTGIWLRALSEALAHDDEVEICEATRMLLAYVRHLRMTGRILADRQPAVVDMEDSRAKLAAAERLLRDALGHVKDRERKQRIEGRLGFLEELKAV